MGLFKSVNKPSDIPGGIPDGDGAGKRMPADRDSRPHNRDNGDRHHQLGQGETTAKEPGRFF